MAIFEREVRSATVRAMGHVRALTLDKRTLLRRIQEDPSLAFHIIQTMARRIRELSDRLAAFEDREGAGAVSGARGDESA
jgi:CRP-like cAMP-binding protein